MMPGKPLVPEDEMIEREETEMRAEPVLEVGMVGLGRMGMAIALRLAEQGCRVIAWNRSEAPRREARAAGIAVVDRPADLVKPGRIILTCLFDDAALKAVCLGEGGLLSQAAQDVLFVDLSTVLPATIREIHARAIHAGSDLADSPVLGTVAPARAGQLIAMVGASPTAFEHARPLLAKIARKVVHVGPTGSGAATKLSVNIPMTAYWAAMADSFALGARYGVPVETILGILADSPAAIGQLPLKMDVLLRRTTAVGFPMTSVLKDIDLMRLAAGEHVLKTIDGAMVTYRDAIAIRGDGDVAAVALAHVPAPPSS